ncbi:MAG: zinc ribbon domain-containing protein [Candidatus Spechtbacterales bacterium]
MSEQFPKINKPEGSEKNGNFWEKKYDDGNGVEKTIVFCPQCGGQVLAAEKEVEAGEHACSHCGFEGNTV